MGQVLRYSFTPPRRLSGQDDMRYLVTTFIDGLRDCYRRNGLLRKSFDVEACGSFLLGYRGTLYTIDSDFQIGHMHGGFSAVGCGAQIALGAMHAMRAVDLSPRKKILAALDAAERFSAGVRGPFSIVVTKKHVV
jgi:ATP-dependent protease HslVU (ClpYQ) peptidase subunit